MTSPRPTTNVSRENYIHLQPDTEVTARGSAKRRRVAGTGHGALRACFPCMINHLV